MLPPIEFVVTDNPTIATHAVMANSSGDNRLKYTVFIGPDLTAKLNPNDPASVAAARETLMREIGRVMYADRSPEMYWITEEGMQSGDADQGDTDLSSLGALSALGAHEYVGRIFAKIVSGQKLTPAELCNYEICQGLMPGRD